MSNVFNSKPIRVFGGQLGFNQLGGLTPDTFIPTGNPIIRGTGTGIGLGTFSPSATPPFVPTLPPPPPPPGTNSTVQQISNTVTGQLKFDQIAALISQGIAAWGKNPSQQISGLTVRPVQPAQNYQPYGAAGQQYTTTTTTGTTNGGVGVSAVNTATGFFDGIAQSFGISPTILFLLIGGGAYLLLREPPKRR